MELLNLTVAILLLVELILSQKRIGNEKIGGRDVAILLLVELILSQVPGKLINLKTL